MPEKFDVAMLFDTFIAGLRSLIKEKVSEAVSRATAEFCHCPSCAAVAPTPKPAKPNRGRRRHRAGRGMINQAHSPRPVRLSKNGKRIGRPPKRQRSE